MRTNKSKKDRVVVMINGYNLYVKVVFTVNFV